MPGVEPLGLQVLGDSLGVEPILDAKGARAVDGPRYTSSALESARSNPAWSVFTRAVLLRGSKTAVSSAPG